MRLHIVLFSATETGSENDVTHSEEGTINIESLSLRETDSQADDSILSRDDAVSRDLVSRDTALKGVGARPKTTKTLQRKNTPAVLPKVASLYGSSPSSSHFADRVMGARRSFWHPI